MSAPRLGLFGLYDARAPRLQTLLGGLDALGVETVSCHVPAFEGLDRERLAQAPWTGAAPLLGALHQLWRRRGELKGVDALLVPYPGHGVLPLARRVARGLGVPVVFDPFLSLYDTVVGDRALVAPGSLAARALVALDRTALKQADMVLADTPAMAAYYRALAPGMKACEVVPVGADEALFAPQPEPAGPPWEVLFVGSMLPLHGLETILAAAARLPELHFTLVGQGPFDVATAARGLTNVTTRPHVAFDELPALYAGAHVCLGAFGASEKAGRVVPHKVYQAAAMARAVVTRAGAGPDEAFGPAALVRVPPADPEALAAAIMSLVTAPEWRRQVGLAAYEEFGARYAKVVLARALAKALVLAGAGSFRAVAGMS